MGQTQLKLKNSEPDNPANGRIYLIGFITIVFLILTIVGLKFLHSSWETKISKDYEKRHNPQALKNQKESHKFSDHVNKQFKKELGR